MRRIDGWYPSIGDFKALEPRADPTEWLADASVDGDPDAPPSVRVNVGDELDFDHWVPAGTATMFSGDGDGSLGFHLSPGAPLGWGVCRNPLASDTTEFASLEDFAAYWLTGGEPVGIEFGTWTLNVPYVVAAGPTAVPA